MRICPVCHTRYDEEILRFCTKDGTPLVEENPTFTQLPSESEEAEDIGEETLIRRNAPAAQPFSDDDIEEDSAQPGAGGQRIVIPTTEAEKEVVRAKTVPAGEQRQANPPRKSNMTLVVLVTMLGTIVVLGVLGATWYVLSSRKSANSNNNKNINVNLAGNSNAETNLNTNSLPVNLDFNSNINANTNVNVNTNVNTNLATPTRTPTPTPTPTPDNANANTNSGLNLGNTNVMTRPSPSPGETPANTAAPTPRTNPSPETTTTPTQPVNVGIMNSRAVNLVKPAYPQEAKQANASGQVTVQIAVDEIGNVISAKAVSGNPLLRAAAENAARQSRFNPVKVNDRIVKASGTVVYNFINQ